MHARDPRQLGLEMRNRAQVWLIDIEITEGATQKAEQLRLVMIALGANFNQLDKIGRGLGTEIIFPDPRKGIAQRDFGKGMEIRLSARGNGDIGFEKQIQFAGKRTLGAARAFGHGLNAAQ